MAPCSQHMGLSGMISNSASRLAYSGQSPTGSLEHERDLQVNPEVNDLVVLKLHLLVLDPGALDVLDGLAGPPDPIPDRVVEAVRGFGADLDDLGNGHEVLLL